MIKVKRIIGRFIYFFARKMPPSFSAVKIGQRQIRAFCGHLILHSCGKNVNIEKNAEFDSSVRIGNPAEIIKYRKKSSEDDGELK